MANRLSYSKVRRKEERLKHHERKGHRKAKTYYDKSCPNCGLPDKGYGQGALNRFGLPTKSSRCKCLICKEKLND